MTWGILDPDPQGEHQLRTWPRTAVVALILLVGAGASLALLKINPWGSGAGLAWTAIALWAATRKRPVGITETGVFSTLNKWQVVAVLFALLLGPVVVCLAVLALLGKL